MIISLVCEVFLTYECDIDLLKNDLKLKLKLEIVQCKASDSLKKDDLSETFGHKILILLSYMNYVSCFNQTFFQELLISSNKTKITSLIVAKYEFSELPVLKKLTYLNEISFNKLKLKYLCDASSVLPTQSLIKLDFSMNQIVFIQRDFFKKFSELKSINFSCNNLLKITSLIFNVKSMESIDFTGNLFEPGYGFGKVELDENFQDLKLNFLAKFNEFSSEIPIGFFVEVQRRNNELYKTYETRA